MRYGLIFIALVFLGLGALVAYGQAKKKSYETLEDTKDLKRRIARLAAEYTAKRANVGLVIGVIQATNKYVQGFGRSGLSNAAPPDAQTIYEIGSITKVFTAVTLARLAEEGVLKLDATIAQYLPKDLSLPEGKARQITFEHLATHTSGLPRLPQNFSDVVHQDPNPYARYHASDLYEALRTIKVGEPGEKMAYSNLGFGLLGHLMELRTQKVYEALVREKVLVPLKMTNTAAKLSVEQKSRLIPGFDAKGKSAANWDFDVMAGAGALRSSAEDMLKFLEANLQPKETSIASALQSCQKTHFKNPAQECGLGWQIANTLEGLKIHWHNGGTVGYYSFAGLDREHQTAVVILSNYGDAFANDHSADKMGLEILKLASRISIE